MTLAICWVAAGAISTLTLASLVLVLLWPPAALGWYIADHTVFVAKMAGVDSRLWTAMFVLVALAPTSLLVRIVIKVWWRLIGEGIFKEEVVLAGHEIFNEECPMCREKRLKKEVAEIADKTRRR